MCVTQTQAHCGTHKYKTSGISFPPPSCMWLFSTPLLKKKGLRTQYPRFICRESIQVNQRTCTVSLQLAAVILYPGEGCGNADTDILQWFAVGMSNQQLHKSLQTKTRMDAFYLQPAVLEPGIFSIIGVSSLPKGEYMSCKSQRQSPSLQLCSEIAEKHKNYQCGLNCVCKKLWCKNRAE